MHNFFDAQVCDVLKMSCQRVYLSRGQLHAVFLALIISRLRYSLPAWSGLLSREQVGHQIF